MTTGDLKLIREFVDRAPGWYARQKGKYVCICGVIPDRMMQLAKALQALLDAYDQKHGTTKGHTARK